MKKILNLIKYVLTITFTIGIFFIVMNSFKTEASTKLKGIENFPDSYKPYLIELLNKHPTWSFTALYTNLDWNNVIKEENVFGKNLVPISYSDSWKNTDKNKYNVEVDSGWVDSSKQAIEYCMDPRNFLNEIRIFQFEELSYNSQTNSLHGIEKILYGTEFYNKVVSYLDNSGNKISMNEKYSDLILKAGQISYVSPYHLASRIKQEVGPYLSHSSISGNVQGYEGLYNFYNIGATSSTENLGAIKNGLEYARNGKGANAEIKNKYLIPWNTKEKAITGGAIFIGASYINVGQNTIYLQKFDINDYRSSSLFWHQYMTNVLAPYSESKSVYNGYESIGLLDTSISFIIPVYNNMPNIQVENPNIKTSDFKDDNTKVYCNATRVNVRTGPSTSYEIITTISNPTQMTRIKKGVHSGDKWDKVILENGIVGYIYQSYVTEIPETQIEKIELSIDNTTLDKGERYKLQVNIYPEEAQNHGLQYSSSNPEVATIDNDGNIMAIHSGITVITVKSKENNVQSQINIKVYSKVTEIILDQSEIYMQIGDSFQIKASIKPDDASNKNILFDSSDLEIATIDGNGMITANKEGEIKLFVFSEENMNIKSECNLVVVRKLDESEIQFDNSFKLNSLEISGIDYNHNTVLDIRDNIITNLDIEIVNSKNEILDEDDLVGTGCKIRVKENGLILREYKIVLYGDVNGDGKINSVDLLVLQRYILEITSLEDVYLKAGNINKNGKLPTSLDLLLIQRHILEIKLINQ